MARRPADRVCVVLITTPTQAHGLQIARALVRRRLAACVNCVPRVRSIFTWQGRIEDCTETLLIVKTTRRRVAALMQAVRTLHRYDVPAILVVPTAGGSEAYLRWVVRSCVPQTEK